MKAFFLALLILCFVQSPVLAQESTAGRFILASPDMPANAFSRTVILMVDHDESGAFGLTLTQQLSAGPLGDVLRDMGIARQMPDVATQSNLPVRVVAGGPVEQMLVLLLHSGEATQSGLQVTDGIAMIDTIEALALRGEDTPEITGILALGYAGWGPGQLESEFARGDWITADADADLVFDTPASKLWDAIMAQLPTDL